MCMTLHLSALKRSCHLSAQSTSLSMPACIVCLSDSVWTVDETLVSSAYIVHHDSRISGRSLIKITNSTGPSTLSYCVTVSPSKIFFNAAFPCCVFLQSCQFSQEVLVSVFSSHDQKRLLGIYTTF